MGFLGNGKDLQWILHLLPLLISVTYTLGTECYICSGSFPERDCELWPDAVKYGPGKQECASRFCTVQVRYRPMQHLLIPLPNQLTATATPLRPEDFEVVSIQRNCVDRVDEARNNRCLPDGGGFGATCFSSCKGELCNSGLRKPNHTELGGKAGQNLPPTGPNEFDQWTPPTARRTTTTTTTTKPPITTSVSHIEEGKRSKGEKNGGMMGKGNGEGKKTRKNGRFRGGKENVPGYTGMETGESGAECNQAKLMFVVSMILIFLL